MVMTEKGSKKFNNYLDKARLKQIVSDRCFLSELVYTRVFERYSTLKVSEYEQLLEYYLDNDWQIIILNASPKCLSERLNLRGDEDDYKVHNIDRISRAYYEMSIALRLPMLDSETLDIDQLIKDLEEGKYVRHCSK
jgi:thymidylate kinase